MKKYCTFIILATFFLIFTSVSNAMDGGSGSEAPRHQIIRKHILGFADFPRIIFSCVINSEDETPVGPCRKHRPAFHIKNIAVAPHTSYAYVTSAGRRGFNNTIHICHIVGATGILERCRPTGVNIPFPTQVTINTSGQFMYVGTANGLVYYCPINQDTSMPHDCRQVGNVFTEIRSISISPLNNYIYLINETNLTICRINPDFTFGECDSSINDLYTRPDRIAAEPSGRYVYIADSSKPHLTVCKAPLDTPNFQGCSIAHKFRLRRPANLISIAIPPYGHYVYIGSMQGFIYTCAINYDDGKFSKCTSFMPDDEYYDIRSLAFY